MSHAAPTHARGRSIVARAAAAFAVLLVVAGCSTDDAESDDPSERTSRAAVEAAPEVGSCRDLDADAVAQPSNDSASIDCAEQHTAETIAVEAFPALFDDAAYDDARLGEHVFPVCSKAFQKHLRADDSAVMRTVLSWAWFRPDEQAWDDGARWFRCDLIGGNDALTDYLPLPEKTKKLLEGRPPDEWMVCADGKSMSSTKVVCSQPHTWRAVTTIKVGEEKDPYPGDRIVEVTSRDYCSDSVGAWLGYPDSYDFGYTYFKQSEWDVGVRRSVCWARTHQ
ncbi:septum formation family protein [Nocardioides acrostichi]|uniref:Septum formation family protein n=1 Tax=Nocardioides acrostichi TaxID=2784339 RepID=A0A930Y8T3_9ACTN|nr:septum formation family protein [Nocardioides acrostichi]MBF4163401.1 septum formation family protein [Nocardioides acrostichi]